MSQLLLVDRDSQGGQCEMGSTSFYHITNRLTMGTENEWEERVGKDGTYIVPSIKLDMAIWVGPASRDPLSHVHVDTVPLSGRKYSKDQIFTVPHDC